MTINATQELSQILIYVADVATALRLNSPYSGDCECRDPREVGQDVMWLSDSLHCLDRLGRAIRADDDEAIVNSCDSLLYYYRTLVNGTPGRHGKGSSKATMERYEHLFDPRAAMDLFVAIRAKANAAARSEETEGFLREIAAHVQRELETHLIWTALSA